MVKYETRNRWITISVVAAVLGVMPIAPLQAQEDAPPPQRQDNESRSRFDERRSERPRMRESRETMRRPRRFGKDGAARGDDRMKAGRGNFGGKDHRLSDDEIDKAMDVLREYDAKVAAHAQSLKEQNPERYRTLVRRYMPQIRRLMYLKETHPESYQLHLSDTRLGADSDRLARELRETRDNEDRTASLRKELRDVVTRHFDIRQQIKERQLERLEQSVVKLREQIQQRREMKPSLIDDRMQELTGKKRDRMW